MPVIQSDQSSPVKDKSGRFVRGPYFLPPRHKPRLKWEENTYDVNNTYTSASLGLVGMKYTWIYMQQALRHWDFSPVNTIATDKRMYVWCEPVVTIVMSAYCITVHARRLHAAQDKGGLQTLQHPVQKITLRLEGQSTSRAVHAGYSMGSNMSTQSNRTLVKDINVLDSVFYSHFKKQLLLYHTA